MPIKASVDHEGRFVRVQFEGRIGLAEIFRELDNLLEQGVMPYPKLFDMGVADLAFDDNDIMSLAARIRAYAELRPRGPVALVAGRKQSHGSLWRLKNLAQGERPFEIFESAEEATDWLARRQHAARPSSTP
ncbi:MAG: hypothetical protein JOY81_00900 [Alphaproteobacteria bacterium]|nr:hypothetical protein [Alphaproteobacteria bacterium]